MNWREILVSPETSILDTLKVIDEIGSQFSMVVDEDMHLLGVATDGNIRRGLLRGLALTEPISSIMNSDPIWVDLVMGSANALTLMLEKDLSHVPVLGNDRKIVGLWSRKELQQNTVYQNPVIIMAGGLGTRLGELTRYCPKPMLRVGGKPLLEIMIQSFLESGFHNFFLAVNYQSEVIKTHFKDGSSFGVKISYLCEKERLGTAGALSLIPERPKLPFIVINGDILTRIRGNDLLNAHQDNGTLITAVVKSHEVQVPYGVVDYDTNGRMSAIREKPVLRFPVSAGINVLSPEVLDFIPRETYFDMPNLFRVLLEAGHRPAVFEITSYWLDIGLQSDYRQANEDFSGLFES